MTWCWYVVLMIVDYTRFTLLRIWLMFFLCAVLFFRFIVSVFAFWIQYAFLVIFPSQAKGKILTRLDVQVVTRNVAPASECLFSSSNDAKMIYFLGFLFRLCTWQRISSLYWMLCELQMFWKYRYISKNVFEVVLPKFIVLEINDIPPVWWPFGIVWNLVASLTPIPLPLSSRVTK